MGNLNHHVIFLLIFQFLFFENLARGASDTTQNLPVLQDPFVTQYRDHLNVLSVSFDPIELEDAIETIRKFPTLQAYEIVYKRLSELPKNAENTEIPDLKKAIKEFLHAFEILAHPADIKMLSALGVWVVDELNDGKIAQRIEYTSARIQAEGAILHPKLMNLNDLNTELLQNSKFINGRILSPSISASNHKVLRHRRALRDIENFYKDLDKRWIGQEEIKRAFQNMVTRDVMLDGERTRPEVFYFMGLPGNGKDTGAEALSDALYGQEGAHKDHLFLMSVRSKEEAWSYQGSGKGYIGSTELPYFLKWLVRHSGGKYQLVTEGEGQHQRLVVHRNPEWKQVNISYTYGPHKATIFVNEVHNIPKEVKDNILKQSIEKGIFKINNPGSDPNAVSEIVLPVNFILASNEGIDLLEPRNRNGTRIGKPLSYQDLHANWERVYDDKDVLKDAILRNNGGINDRSLPGAPGTSEEFINRIPGHHLFLLEPLSPEQLVQVAQLMADKELAKLHTARGRLGKYDLQISREMYRFLVDYRYIASENARPIEARINEFILDPFFEAIRRKKIPEKSMSSEVFIDVKQYKNGAHSTTFDVIDTQTGNVVSFNRLIRRTLQDVPKPPLERQRIQELMSLKDKMKLNVFGVEHIADQLAESAIAAESASRNSGDELRPATVMAFLGKSSTGKTETAKQYVKARYGDDAKPAFIDFNGVRSVESMEAKILGSFDANKNPIPSEFMKQYDRAQGKITFLFDEAANAPKDLLKSLYEVLRESVVYGFSDGKPRSMNNVTIILTGNAGEQIYEMIPMNLPKAVYERALSEVFRIFLQNNDMQHRLMLETFPDALLARIGKNIIHFGPLEDGPIRQLTQLKLRQGLETLEPKRSETGWNVSFDSETDLLRLFDLIELYGFNSREQGASIDKFVRETIVDKIRVTLLMENVPTGNSVRVKVAKEVLQKQERDLVYQFAGGELVTANGKSIPFEIPLGKHHHQLEQSQVDQVFTAYHEVGHEVVSRVFFGDVIQPNYLSIIEGVAFIDQKFISYKGVRSGVYKKEIAHNKAVALREAAELAAGYVAQQLISIGARDDQRKSNDIERITSYIQGAILKGGLSKRWGMRSIPAGMKLGDYVGNVLTSSERELLSEITRDWIQEAEQLAREALLVNFDKLVVNMSKELAKEGKLDKGSIENFYKIYGVNVEFEAGDYEEKVEKVNRANALVDTLVEANQESFQLRFQNGRFDLLQARGAILSLANQSPDIVDPQQAWDGLSTMERMAMATRLASHIRAKTRDAELSSKFFMPEVVANIEAIIAEGKKKAIEAVTDLKPFKVEKRSSGAMLRCSTLFN